MALFPSICGYDAYPDPTRPGKGRWGDLSLGSGVEKVGRLGEET